MNECVVDSCGEPSEYAGAYRLGDRKIILHFCERHFDETHDHPLDFDDPKPGDTRECPLCGGTMVLHERITGEKAWVCSPCRDGKTSTIAV